MLWVTCLKAQAVIEVRFGASTLYGADGGSVVLNLPDAISEADFGVVNGHLAFGAGVHTISHGCHLFLGDKQVYFSTASTGLAASVRGTTATCTRGRTQLSAFLGAVGVSRFAPYMLTSSATHFGAGFMATEHLGAFDITGVSALNGNQRVLLESVRWKWRKLTAEETGGLALNGRYLESQASWNGTRISANLQRTDGQGAPSTDAEGISVNFGAASLAASLFQSGRLSGETFGGTFRFGAVSATGVELLSTRKQSVGIFTENLPLHLSANESVGNGAASFGGGIRGNVASANLGTQLLWVANAGFQRAISVDAALQLPRVTVHFALLILPGNRFLWSGYGNSFLAGGALSTGTNHLAE